MTDTKSRCYMRHLSACYSYSYIPYSNSITPRSYSCPLFCFFLLWKIVFPRLFGIFTI